MQREIKTLYQSQVSPVTTETTIQSVSATIVKRGQCRDIQIPLTIRDYMIHPLQAPNKTLLNNSCGGGGGGGDSNLIHTSSWKVNVIKFIEERVSGYIPNSPSL